VPFLHPAQAGAPDLWSFPASPDDHGMTATEYPALRPSRHALFALRGDALTNPCIPIGLELVFAAGHADNHGTEAFN
jgi:hypothetical protein